MNMPLVCMCACVCAYVCARVCEPLLGPCSCPGLPECFILRRAFVWALRHTILVNAYLFYIYIYALTYIYISMRVACMHACAHGCL